jgi:hypothetical protein
MNSLLATLWSARTVCNGLVRCTFPLGFVILSLNCAAQVEVRTEGANLQDSSNKPSTHSISANKSEEWKNRYRSLQADIARATELVNKAGTPDSERMKQLDVLAESLQSALKEVSPNGGLYSELKKTIDFTEAKSKAWHEKSLDPSVSAQMQLKYWGLENKFLAAKEMLHKGMKALDAQRVDLEKRLKDVKEDRDFVVEMMAAGDFKEATTTLDNVSKTFDKHFQNISGSGISEKTK